MYKITYTGDGVTREYAFTFSYFQSSDIKVSINSDLLAPGDYSVIKTPDAPVDGKYTGGHIILNTAPAIGATIVIWRKVELNRIVDYQPTLPISTTSLNSDFNFILEYLRDMYDIDEHAANIENGMQFLDSIQAQITQIGNLSELARKSDLPDLTQYAKISDVPNSADFAPVTHTHDMSSYVTNSTFQTAISEISEELENMPSDFPLQFDEDDEPDVIVKTQLPTAENNYTWYRKYKSGWVEQGGIVDPATPGSFDFAYITLPIQMQGTKFTVVVSPMIGETVEAVDSYNTICVSITSATEIKLATLAQTLVGISWYVAGMSASQQSN